MILKLQKLLRDKADRTELNDLEQKMRKHSEKKLNELNTRLIDLESMKSNPKWDRASETLELVCEITESKAQCVRGPDSRLRRQVKSANLSERFEAVSRRCQPPKRTFTSPANPSKLLRLRLRF
jgi:hypothetical protein